MLYVLLALVQEPWPEPVLRLAHPDPVWRIAFLPDGKRIFSVSQPEKGEGETGRVWDLDSGKELVRVVGAPDRLPGYLTISANGEVIGGIASSLWLTAWDARSGRKLMEIWPAGTITRVALSPDGATIAHNDPRGLQIPLYAVATGKEIRKIRMAEDEDASDSPLAFSPDGSLVAVHIEGKGPSLWGVASGKHVRTVSCPARYVHTPVFSPDGRWLASQSWEPSGVAVHRVADGQEVRLLGEGDREVFRIAFSSDGRLAALVEKAGRVRVRELASQRDLFVIPLRASAVSFAGNRIAVASGREIAIWPLVSGAPLELAPAELEGLWRDLAERDGARAWQALKTLSRGGAATAADLRTRLLKPLERMKERLEELAGGDVAEREKAMEALEEAAHDPALWKALEADRSPEAKARALMMAGRQEETPIPSAGTLRRARAVWALELLGAAEALEAVSKGAPAARQTRDAAEALKRIRR